MKKIPAILLLSIFLFNWIGYRLLTCFLEAKADVQLQARLDENNYDDAQLVSVKVPVTHLSYYHNSPVFEIASGKIEIGGILYHYVKRRIYNDSLEVLCIPNQAAMQLQAAKNDFFMSVNGLLHTGTSQGKKHSANTGVSKDVSLEYYQTEGMALPDIPFSVSSQRFADYSFLLASFYALTPEQPPEMAGAAA